MTYKQIYGDIEPDGSMIMLSYYYNQFSLSETIPGVKSYPGHVYLPSGTTDLGLG